MTEAKPVKDKVIVQTKVDPKVLKWVSTQAKVEGMTVAAWVRRMLLQAKREDEQTRAMRDPNGNLAHDVARMGAAGKFDEKKADASAATSNAKSKSKDKDRDKVAR